MNQPNPAQEALKHFDSPLFREAPALVTPIGVAYSGGADSTALLYAAAARWPGQVSAIHIHHGLQAAANDFVEICRDTCIRLNVPLHVVHVDAAHRLGKSPEEAARVARYAALASTAKLLKLRAVLLGQHADDQVETMLLALSRGAGMPGLAAMAGEFERGGVIFIRPLLNTASATLRVWLIEHKLPFVDDPTNVDERYTRNRIRARLLPALAEVFPQFRATFSRSARHAAEAQTLLVEIAAEDLSCVGNPPVITLVQSLSKPRQANVLRHWLLQAHQTTPTAAQLYQLLSQVSACTTRGHHIHLKVGTGYVTRTGVVLSYC